MGFTGLGFRVRVLINLYWTGISLPQTQCPSNHNNSGTLIEPFEGLAWRSKRVLPAEARHVRRAKLHLSATGTYGT